MQDFNADLASKLEEVVGLTFAFDELEKALLLPSLLPSLFRRDSADMFHPPLWGYWDWKVVVDQNKGPPN